VITALVLVCLVLAPVESSATIDVDGWDVKVGVNASRCSG
jgi:hypothetical protein